MPKTIQKIQTQDRILNQIQENVISATTPILNNPITNGVVLASVALKSGLNTVNHLLGRKLVGWIVIRQRAQAQVWDTQDSNLTPNLNLLLNASTAVTVDLYCF